MQMHWKKSRSKIDRNGDGVIQFAMLEGESGHQDTLIRSEWVLKELENKKSRRSRSQAAPETGKKSGERDRTAVDERVSEPD